VQTNRKLLIIPGAMVISLIFLAAVVFLGVEYYATGKVKEEINKHLKEVSQHVKVDYSSLGVNWLAFTVDLHNVKLSKPPLPGAVTIDRVSVRDLSSIGLNIIPTVVTLNNIAFDNKKAQLNVQRFSTSFSLNRMPSKAEMAADWSAVLQNLLAGDLTLENISFAEGKTKVLIRSLMLDYGLGKASLKKPSLKISQISFQHEAVKFTCDSLGLLASLDEKNFLTNFTKNINNFFVKFPPDLVQSNDFLKKLQALGYDQLTVNFDLKYGYQPKTKETNNMVEAAVENLGRLKINLRGGDLNSPPVPLTGGLMDFLSFLEQLKTAPQEASIQALSATYTDLGLASRLLKAEAQARGQSPKDFAQELISNLDAVLLLLPLPATVKDQLKAVNQFLLNPKEIQLAVTFKKPLRLKQLEEGSLDSYLKLLDQTEVKITAK